MLVLSRKIGEKIYINDNITITIVDVDRGKVRVGVEAPREVCVDREEVRKARLEKPKKTLDRAAAG